MLKRKRSPTKKKKPTPKKKGKPEPSQIIAFKPLKSNELPSEIWERIASKLDPRSLVKLANLGPADHWLCFYVENALKNKKLSIISSALQRLYVYGDLEPNLPSEPTTESSPSSAVNLLNCFSTGTLVTVLPNLIADTLQTYVRYFVRNKRRLAPSHLDIYGLVPYDNCPMNLTPQGFYISVRIRLVSDFPLAWASYATHRFCPQDYVIRICQIRDHEGKFHPMPRILFNFFRNFKFNVGMYDSTDWPLGVIPEHLSRGAAEFWSCARKERASARRQRI